MKVEIKKALRAITKPYSEVAHGSLENEIERFEKIATEIIAFWDARKGLYSRFREKGFIGVRARTLGNNRTLAIEWTRGQLYKNRGERKLRMSVIRRTGDKKAHRMSDFGKPGSGCRVWEHQYITQMEPVFAEIRELIDMEREVEKLARKVVAKNEAIMEMIDAMDLPQDDK